MGILVAQMRLAQLNAYCSDLDYNIGLINSTKRDLLNQINDIVGLGSDMDPDSPEMKELQKKQERLHTVEKALDAQLQRYQSQLKMAEQEQESVRNSFDSALQRSYR